LTAAGGLLDETPRLASDAGSVPPSAPRREGRWLAGSFAVYLALGVALYWPIWRSHPASRTPLGADQTLSTWFLAWTAHALVHGMNPFVSNFGNVPGGVNVLNNTGMTLLGVIGTPITLAFGPIATANVMYTVGPAVSALAAYVLVCRFVDWRPAAFIGGLVYGFSPFVVLHAYIHICFTFNAIPPLMFLALYELTVRQRGSLRQAQRWGLLLGLLATAQFFVESEVVATSAIVGAGAVAVAAIVGRRSLATRVRHAAAGLGCAAASAAVLLAYPVWFMLRGPAHIVGPIQLTPQAYRADLLSLVAPSRGQLLSTPGLRHFARDFANHENGSYLGLPLVAVMVAAAVWLRRNAVVVVATLTAAIAFVLSLGGALVFRGAPPSNRSGDASGRVPLPEALVAKVRLLHNIIPARFGMYVVLFAGIVLACVLDRLHGSLSDWPVGQYGVPLGLAAVCLLPLLPATSPVIVDRTGTPAFFTSSAVNVIPAGSVALTFPFPSGTHADGSLWQALAGFRYRTAGGYFRVPQPPDDRIAFSSSLGYTRSSRTAVALVALAHGTPPRRTIALRQAIAAEFTAWHVETFVAEVGRSKRPAESFAFLQWLLGPPTSRAATTYVWSGLRL
jgi:hypothetical protein